MEPTFGAVEAGGTKFVCAIGSEPGRLAASVRIDTTDPDTTLRATTAFFRSHLDDGGRLDAVGVASFGPLELRTDRAGYGHLAATPKPGWTGADILGPIRDLGIPVGFDTDVNGAALGEGRWGNARDLDTYVYVTIGTGLGVGVVANHRVIHGTVHPEVGHVSVSRLPGDDFPGACPYHGDCFEGMTAGPSLAARWGRPAETLTGGELEEAVAIEAHYVAAGLRNVVYTVAPERIIIGGGVAKLPGLLPAVRRELPKQLAGYPGLEEHHQEAFIVPPGLGDGAGIAGAFVLAERALNH